MTDWDRRFLELAAHISTWSKDPSTKVGCVIVGADREVLSTGFNGFPRGVADTEARLNDREQKYPIICHGEENALLQAARIGVPLKGNTAYIYPLPPCSRCARSIIQVGIVRVVFPDLPIPERWRPDTELGFTIMKEAGLELVRLLY